MQAIGRQPRRARPTLKVLGFEVAIHANPPAAYGSLMIATRPKSETLPTMLIYGHGNLVRGQDKSWTRAHGPWTMAVARLAAGRIPKWPAHEPQDRCA